ncbi:ceramidase domain-containing protein [Thalassotalea fusca]
MTPITSKRILLWCIAILAVVSVGQIPPISQDLAYHQFADNKAYLGIPNMWNVLSNLPFLIIGIYGLRVVVENKHTLKSLYWGALTFTLGVILVAFGSGYYHWQPTNQTLVWDRLPMTISFMGLYAMVLSAFVRAKSGLAVLPWLIVVGVVSVIYWAFTEAAGVGDLRLYALVQFLPMVLMLVILSTFRAEGINKSKLIIVLLWYSLAKTLEFADSYILDFTNFISGHSLKHLAAAIACFYVIKWTQVVTKQVIE